MNINVTAAITTTTQVITHSGVFHADEVFSTVLLAKLAGGELNVCRTFRVPADLAEDVIVYDIGGGKFDHHQKGGNGSRENGVPYSSFGLLWKEFGMKIAGNTEVWEMVDKMLVQGIDAIDNGVSVMAGNAPCSVMTASATVSFFNPNWDSEETPDEAFVKAVGFAEVIFDNVLATAQSKARARDIVEKAISGSESCIMILDKFVPWTDWLFESEQEEAKEILFVVFPSNRGGYNWQCVPDKPGSFGQRKTVPVEWKGLKGEELQNVTGVKTATFCHPAGFIGGAETLEDAIALAELAVKA